jgi:hypothetical protein
MLRGRMAEMFDGLRDDGLVQRGGCGYCVKSIGSAGSMIRSVGYMDWSQAARWKSGCTSCAQGQGMNSISAQIDLAMMVLAFKSLVRVIFDIPKLVD